MELTKEQVKLATVATTINWKVVERFTRKFGYGSAEEMLFDWCIDSELVYERGLKRKPNPFHKHVRLNLDKMAMCGICSPEEMIEAGLKLTKKQRDDIKLAQEESEDYVEGA